MTGKGREPEVDRTITVYAMRAAAEALAGARFGHANNVRGALEYAMRGGSTDAAAVFEAWHVGVTRAIHAYIVARKRRKPAPQAPALFADQVEAGWRYEEPAEVIPMLDGCGILWPRRRVVSVRKGRKTLTWWRIRHQGDGDSRAAFYREWLLSLDGSQNFKVLDSRMRDRDDKDTVIREVRRFFGEPGIMSDYLTTRRTLLIPDNDDES